ncbi:hypothetical protein EMCRGX_G027832 [Ephydatia muelleri]
MLHEIKSRSLSLSRKGSSWFSIHRLCRHGIKEQNIHFWEGNDGGQGSIQETKSLKGHVGRVQFVCPHCKQSRTWASSRVLSGHYLANQKLVHAFTCAGNLLVALYWRWLAGTWMVSWHVDTPPALGWSMTCLSPPSEFTKDVTWVLECGSHQRRLSVAV